MNYWEWLYRMENDKVFARIVNHSQLMTALRNGAQHSGNWPRYHNAQKALDNMENEAYWLIFMESEH